MVRYVLRRSLDVALRARKLKVDLSPTELSRCKQDNFERMVRHAQRRSFERETLVSYISKTDEHTFGQQLLLGLDFLGTALFAIVGTQAAGQAGMNVVGAVLVGCVASTGGGTLNNVMTGNTPPFWMRDPRFLVVAIWSSIATFYVWPEYEEFLARSEFDALCKAANVKDELKQDEFERACSDRLIASVKPHVDVEIRKAIEAMPSLAPALVFEFLAPDGKLTHSHLAAVERLAVMTSPLIFGLETLALGAVAVIGAQAGITRGVGPLGSIATGVTICFGGVLRDLLCQREVAIGAQSYALATCAGASVYVGLRQLVVHGIVRLPLLVRICAGASTAILQRCYVYWSDANDKLLPPMRITPMLKHHHHKTLPGAAESLCDAAAKNDVFRLKLLVEEDHCNASVADYDKRTPLHLAASEGAFDAVKFLVEEAHVHLDATDRWGRTPLDDAQTNGHHLIAVYLRGHL